MSIKSLLDHPRPPVIACAPTARLTKAVKTMVENEVNAVAVIDGRGALAGILTDHDVMRAIHAGGGQLGRALVSEWMTPKVITCGPATRLTDALRLMGKHGIRHLVVTEEEKPVAVLGIRRILVGIHAADELEVKVLRELAAASQVASVT